LLPKDLTGFTQISKDGCASAVSIIEIWDKIYMKAIDDSSLILEIGRRSNGKCK
jgi:hypothetical protein